MKYRKVKLYDEDKKTEEKQVSTPAEVEKKEEPKTNQEIAVQVENDVSEKHRSDPIPINKQFLHFIETVVNKYLETNINKQIKATETKSKSKTKKKQIKKKPKLVKKQVKKAKTKTKSLIKKKTLTANKLTNWIYK